MKIYLISPDFKKRKKKRKRNGNLQNRKKNCKLYICYRVNVQDIQRIAITQLKVSNDLILKCTKALNRHTSIDDTQMANAHIKIFNIPNNQGNTSQNYNKISSHIH